MRLRSHLIASVLVGLALYPRAPARAALTALGGIALDADHALLYAVRSGDWSPAGALRYDRRRHGRARRGDTRPRYGSLRSAAHRPLLSVPLAWLLALVFPRLRPLAAGLTLHLAMDAPLQHYDWRVWRRARGRCERCGLGGVPLGVYYVRPPHAGGSPWRLDNREVRCAGCVQELNAAR